MLLAGSFVFSLSMLAEQPRLVVGIVVDGLRQEVLDLLQSGFSDNGFNRFLKNGVVIENIDFGSNLDAAASTAVIMSGASPSVNGIGSERIYEPVPRRTVNIFNDDNVLGNFTDEALSPSSLRVSTISDEARIAGAGVSYVYSIAANPAMALTLASHAGNSAVWFNDKTGNWATSTYFRDTPTAALNANRLHALVNRIDTMQWKPSPKTAAVSGLPDHLIHYPFRHTFTTKDGDRFLKYANSPFINQDISTLAAQYVTGLELGRHDGTDFLNIAYTLKPFDFSRTSENRYELYDSYIKLDKSLSELFTLIDNKVGKDNVTYFIVGTPAQNTRRKDDEKWNIPGGEFSSRKAVSLLNLYLIAIHGNGDWVKGFHNGHFYLNSELAKNKEIDISALRRQAADFLIRMSGVVGSFTIEDIIGADSGVPNASNRARNTVLSQSGDVIIDLIPGWTLIDDFNSALNPSNNISVLAPAVAPFMMSAPGLKPTVISTPVDARAIAPTLARVLRIRPPNGAELSPLTLD